MARGFGYYRSAFLSHLKRENYAGTTIESYTDGLERFRRFLLIAGKSDLTAVSHKEIEDYKTHLRTDPGALGTFLKPGSISCFIKIVKQFFIFLEQQELIFKSPFTMSRQLKKIKSNPPENVLTEKEVTLLFDTPNCMSLKGFRDRTMLELLYCTGIRKSEIVNLDTGDIDLTASLLFIRQGKGRKDRIIPLTKSCLAWLGEYMKKVRTVLLCLDLTEDALFVSRFGKRFSRNTLSRIIREYAVKAGIRKTVSTHTFRHTFASHMIKGGAKVRYVQEILGHEKVSTTRIYTRVYVEDLKKAVKMYHPRENNLYEAGKITLPDRKTSKGEVMLPRVYTTGRRKNEFDKEEDIR